MRLISGERSIRSRVSLIRSSTWPISRRIAESLRLAVSRILPRLVDARLDRVGDAVELADVVPHPAEPGELVADAVEPAGRGWRSPGASRRPRPAPRRRATPPTWARRTSGRMSWRPPKGGERPEARASAISVVRAWRSRISPGSRLGSIRERGLLAERAGGLRAATSARTLSNSSNSSVCVSMTPRRRTCPRPEPIPGRHGLSPRFDPGSLWHGEARGPAAQGLSVGGPFGERAGSGSPPPRTTGMPGPVGESRRCTERVGERVDVLSSTRSPRRRGPCR